MKHYYSLGQCATSIRTLADNAAKSKGARPLSYSQLELISAHVDQVIAMLTDPQQAAAIEAALAPIRARRGGGRA